MIEWRYNILRKQRDEVLGMLLTTFNEGLHEKNLNEVFER